MRNAIVAIAVTGAALVAAGFSKAQTTAPTGSVEIRLDGSRYIGEAQMGAVAQGQTETQAKALAKANTLPLKRGQSFSVSVLFSSGSSVLDVTGLPALKIFPLSTDCFTVSGSIISVNPQERCSSTVDAAGRALAYLGVAYKDDVSKQYGYDVFFVEVK